MIIHMIIAVLLASKSCFVPHPTQISNEAKQSFSMFAELAACTLSVHLKEQTRRCEVGASERRALAFAARFVLPKVGSGGRNPDVFPHAPKSQRTAVGQ